MTIFGRIFGRDRKKPEKLTPQEAIQKLQDMRGLVVKKQDFLESKIEAEVAAVRKHGRTNKRLALQALKRKKRLEKQAEQLDGVLTTVETQRDAIENASSNAQILQVMTSAANALRTAHNRMHADQVHELMEDIAEQQDTAKEIAEAISNPVGTDHNIDDDDLMKELEQIQNEELEKQLLEIPSTQTGKPKSAGPSVGEATVVDESPLSRRHFERANKKTVKVE